MRGEGLIERQVDGMALGNKLGIDSDAELAREEERLTKSALTDRVDDRQTYMKGIDASYRYEGYGTYTMEELA